MTDYKKDLDKINKQFKELQKMFDEYKTFCIMYDIKKKKRQQLIEKKNKNNPFYINMKNKNVL